MEALLSGRITNQPPDAQLSAWLAGLPDKIHAKLALVDLVQPRTPPPTAPMLGAWLDKYIGQREGDLKPASIRDIRHTATLLRDHFGCALAIDAITRDSAADWRSGLAASGVAEATVRKNVRNAKAIFSEAVDRELIGANPFRKLVSAAIAAERNRYVTPAEICAILEVCSDPKWRVLFGLARMAGLRVPSETHILTWSDVDWEKSRLIVRSPKTERYPGKDKRLVPIVPALMAILQDAYDAAEDGTERTCGLSKSNLPRKLYVILKRAGIDPFPRCFQVLRQSCETEWSQRFPQYAVSAWLGHSEKVSREHYLMIPDDLWKSAAECAAVSPGIESQGLANNTDDTPVMASEAGKTLNEPSGKGIYNPQSPIHD